ncbi:MAG: peptidase M2 family protein, partial [Pseudoxanthomonas sp.]
MKQRHLLLALAIGACVVTLAACKKEPGETAGSTAQTAPKGETADQFIARINQELRKSYPEISSAQWLSSTYINDDTQQLAA